MSDGQGRRVRWLAAALAALLVASVVLVVSRNSRNSPNRPNHDDRSGPHSSGATPAAPRTGGAVVGTPAGTSAAGVGAPTAGPAAGGAPTTGVRRATSAPRPRPGPIPSLPATTPRTTSAPDPSGKRWLPVASIAGTTNGRSAPFHLAGVDTRLVYRSDSGSFAVFLVDERQGREATAGYADLDCAEPCAGEIVLVDPTGNYHLEVDTSGGAYEVSIEEYRRPGR